MVSQWRSSVNLHNWNTLEDNWKATGRQLEDYWEHTGYQQFFLQWHYWGLSAGTLDCHWIATARTLVQGKGYDTLISRAHNYSASHNTMTNCESICDMRYEIWWFTAQKSLMRNFDVLFDLRLNQRSIKQSWGWWFETPSNPLSRRCNGNIAFQNIALHHKIYKPPNTSITICWFHDIFISAARHLDIR